MRVIAFSLATDSAPVAKEQSIKLLLLAPHLLRGAGGSGKAKRAPVLRCGVERVNSRPSTGRG